MFDDKKIHKHWKQIGGTTARDHESHPQQRNDLHPFTRNLQENMPKGIIYNLIDYLELVDWTGRQIREGKAESISEEVKPILQRLLISPEHWVYLCTNFESRFKGLVGTTHSLEHACQTFQRKRRPNLAASTRLFT